MSQNVQYHITTRARHLRFIFFIGDDYPISELKKLMIQNMRLWGGRHNPIVPVTANSIEDGYKSIIKFYDPDVVYYSASVSIDFLKSTFDFNPQKFINLSEPSEFRMEGVAANYFQGDVEKRRPRVASIGETPKTLIDFYKLNFLCTEHDYQVPSHPSLGTFEVDQTGYSSLCEFLSKKQPELRSKYSEMNLENVLFRSVETAPNGLEMVVAKTENSQDDLLYFWNRKMFLESYGSNLLFLTVNEIRELLKDKYFEDMLLSLSLESRVNICSFTMNMEELTELATNDLNPIVKRVQFILHPRTEFPFRLHDSHELHYVRSGQPINSQMFSGSSGLLYIQNLDFTIDKRKSNKWVVDLEIKSIRENGSKTIKFSNRLEHRYYIDLDGRINKRRHLSLFVDSGNKSVRLEIPEFISWIKHIFYAPKIFADSIKTDYKRVRLNADGARLHALVNLFHGYLNDIDNLFLDKFWFDILIELSSNVRIAGDTVTLNEIMSRCLDKMNEVGISLDENTHRNAENLKNGLIGALTEFCDWKVFFIGHNITCSICSSKFWYSISELKEHYNCKGCGNEERIPVELPFAYKLNDLVKNNLCSRDAKGKFHSDGNQTVLKTLLRLYHANYDKFEFSPQMDIYNDQRRDAKPLTDIDILCLLDGKLVIGEAKHHVDGFESEKHKALDNLIAVAKVILPDVVLLSCSEGSPEKLEKKRKYVANHLKKNPIAVQAFKVIEPSYQFEHYWYFRD